MAQGAIDGLDCAKAATPIERDDLRQPELAAVDRKMAAAYAALIGQAHRRGEGSSAGRSDALARQPRIACVVEPAEIEECLEIAVP